jgi:hypothetical protein
MQTVFADTFYWIALLNPNDEAHARAATVSKDLISVRIVTTDEVLTEFLNYFAERGPFLRRAAARRHRLVIIIEVDLDLLYSAIPGFSFGLAPTGTFGHPVERLVIPTRHFRKKSRHGPPRRFSDRRTKEEREPQLPFAR